MVRFTRSPRKKIRHGVPDTPYDEIRVVNPSRGLNQLVADILTDNKDASDLSNIEFAEGGVVRKRPGYQAIGTGIANVANGLGIYKSGTDQSLVISDGGTLKRYMSGAWATITGVTVDATAPISMTSVGTSLYVWDGINGGVMYDGTASAQPGTMPKGRFSVTYKDFHIVSGVDGQKNRVYIAGIKDPARFTRQNAPTDTSKIDLSKPAQVPGATVFTGDDSPNAIDVNRYDGDKITGFGFFQDALIICKENSLYQMTFNDQNIPVVQRITDAYGCVSHGSIATVENDMYFLGRFGIMVLGNEPNYYASIRTNELSSRIKPIVERIKADAYNRCKSIYWDNRYILSVPIETNENSLLIVYDKRFYAWSLWRNVNASGLAVLIDSNNKRQLVFTDSKLPMMNQFTWGLYNDNGVAIDAWWTSRAFHGRKVDIIKYWRELRPIFRQITGTVYFDFFDENGSFGGTIPLNVSLEGGIGVDELGAAEFGTSMTDTYTEADLGLVNISSVSSATDSSNVVKSIGVKRDARTFKFRISNNNLDETFVLLGFAILFKNKSGERFDSANVYR